MPGGWLAAASGQPAIAVGEGMSLETVRGEVLGHRPQQRRRIDAGGQAMDGVEVQRIVVDVHQFHQRVASRMLRCSALGLQFLPHRLRRGEGVVAVAHGVGQRRFASAQGGNGGGDAGNGFGIGDVPAAHPAAALHELEVVGWRPVLRKQRFDDRTLGIIDKHHDVRRLQERVAAHRGARRQPRPVRAFGAADESPGAGPIVETLQIQRHHQSPSRRAAEGAFHQHEARRHGHQHVFRVFAHALVDGGNRRVPIGVAAQFGLRQHEMQRGRMVAGQLPGLLPVGRLRGVLIAGDHRPRGQRHARLRQQQRRHVQGDFRVVALHLLFACSLADHEAK